MIILISMVLFYHSCNLEDNDKTIDKDQSSCKPCELQDDGPSKINAGTGTSDHPQVGFLKHWFWQGFCSAVLVAPDVILTAKHCIDEFNFNLSDIKYKSGSETRGIKDMVFTTGLVSLQLHLLIR